LGKKSASPSSFPASLYRKALRVCQRLHAHLAWKCACSLRSPRSRCDQVVAYGSVVGFPTSPSRSHSCGGKSAAPTRPPAFRYELLVRRFGPYR